MPILLKCAGGFIQIGLQDTCEGIKNSFGLINNKMYEDDELLEPSQSGGKKKQRKQEAPPKQNYEVQLFVPVVSNCIYNYVRERTYEQYFNVYLLVFLQ